jgi:hypothetical protein
MDQTKGGIIPGLEFAVHVRLGTDGVLNKSGDGRIFPDPGWRIDGGSGQGGLIPWQTGLITPVGRFQFMLGREIGVYLYGSSQGADAFLIPDERSTTGNLSLMSMHSTRLDFPFLGYRPVRTFSRKQSANFFLQLTAGVDIPNKVKMKSPANIESMDLKPV